MTEQQRPDEDAEDHGFRWGQDSQAIDEDQFADDAQGHIRFQETEDEASGDYVEGHGRSYAQEEGSLDDVAGHGRTKLEDEASEHDVKGHGYKWGPDAEAVDEDQVSDDVGGHQMPRRPL